MAFAVHILQIPKTSAGPQIVTANKAAEHGEVAVSIEMTPICNASGSDRRHNAALAQQCTEQVTIVETSS